MGHDLNDKRWNNLVEDQETALIVPGDSNPTGSIIAGVYRSTLPTYTDGDAVIPHFSDDGRLMVDTELTLDGSVVINNLGGAAAHDAAVAGNPVLIGVEAKDFDGSALPNDVDEGDVVRLAASQYGVGYTMLTSEDGSTSPQISDDSAQIATPTMLNVGGEYRSSATTYTDGDATILQSDVNGNLKVVTVPRNKPTVTNATGSSAISTTTSVSDNFKLNSITVHFDSAPTTSEDLTVTIDANDGSEYDTVVFSTDPSEDSATDVVFIPDGELLLENGDEIQVDYTNTDGNTYGLRIVTQTV